MSAFDRKSLEAEGFVGWVPFRQLTRASVVPSVGGVYLVWRDTLDTPTFLEVSPAGHFKGRNPTVAVDVLAAKWVPAHVVYIGMTQAGLRGRLRSFRRYGEGEPVGHQGGRYIWQLADADDLLVAWKPIDDPASVEAALLRWFRDEHGQLPFANLNAGRRPVTPSAGSPGVPARPYPGTDYERAAEALADAAEDLFETDEAYPDQFDALRRTWQLFVEVAPPHSP